MQCPCGKRCSHTDFWRNSPECFIAHDVKLARHEIPYDFKNTLYDEAECISPFALSRAVAMLRNGIRIITYECPGCCHRAVYFEIEGSDEKRITRVHVEGRCE